MIKNQVKNLGCIIIINSDSGLHSQIITNSDCKIGQNPSESNLYNNEYFC